jgi:hypothetical protein
MNACFNIPAESVHTTYNAANANDGSIMIKKWIPFKRKITFKQDDSPAFATAMKNKLVLDICSTTHLQPLPERL